MRKFSWNDKEYYEGGEKEMCKKKYYFLVTALIGSTLMAAGCSNKRKVDNSPLNPMATYKFSDGMEWLRTTSISCLKDSYICVDQEGNALFSMDTSDISSVSPFSGGYSFIEKDKMVYQIDSSGNIINSYTNSDDVKVKTYADGQIWIEEYKSDFDSAGYTYTLYDENGKEVTGFSIEGTDPIDEIGYCGKGVWRYRDLDSDGDWITMYYCTQSDKWIERNTSENSDVYFYEDTAVLGFDYENPNETGYRAKMILMDTTGNLSEVSLTGDLGWNWDSDTYVNEGYCILEEYDDYLISYNISSGEFKVMDNEYTEKVRMAALPDKLIFMDGCVALPLRGNDEKDYVGLFDTSWNIIGEPIQGTRFDFSEGKLMVERNASSENEEGNHIEVVVYDTKGTQIFNTYEKGYETITPYEDGVAYVLDEDTKGKTSVNTGLLKDDDILGALPYEWKCIDEKGEYLFDTVNLDGVKTVELK